MFAWQLLDATYLRGELPSPPTVEEQHLLQVLGSVHGKAIPLCARPAAGGPGW